MATAILRGTRWAATPVVAMLGTLLVQVAVFKATIELVYATVGIGPGGSAFWAVKTFTSIFMGGAFVALASWAAPEVKLRAAAVALVVVLLWGSRLMLNAFDHGFMGWLFATGAAGIAGGAWGFWIVQKRSAARG
jgi:hypothetical protein